MSKDLKRPSRGVPLPAGEAHPSSPTPGSPQPLTAQPPAPSVSLPDELGLPLGLGFLICKMRGGCPDSTGLGLHPSWEYALLGAWAAKRAPRDRTRGLASARWAGRPLRFCL